MNAGTHPSRWTKRIGAVLLGAVLAPVAAEIAYRVLRTAGLSPTTNPAYVEHDAWLGWHYRPGMSVRHVSAEFDVTVRTNAQGFRGPDWKSAVDPESPHAPRVLVLGDSYAFGWGVEYEQSLPARIEALHPEWDVLGAAVSGYGTDQECLLLEQLDTTVRPDVVVVVFCENDLLECAGDESYGKRKPRFVRDAGGLRLEGVPVPYPVIERVSLVWRAIRKAVWERSAAARTRDLDAEWALVCDIYRRMHRALGGRPLVIVSDEPRLASFASMEAGVEHLDLRDVFGVDAASLHFPIDGHWNAAGHARAAEALARALRPLLE